MGLAFRWVKKSGEYEHNLGDPDCLEEHLNFINQYHLSHEEIDKYAQLDLLLPIKPIAKV